VLCRLVFTVLGCVPRSPCLQRGWFSGDDVPLQLSCSVVAGLAIASTTAPIDFARSRLMVHAHASSGTSGGGTASGLAVVRWAVASEGWRALYRGFLPQWLRCAPYTVLQFVAWEKLCAAAGVRAV